MFLSLSKAQEVDPTTTQDDIDGLEEMVRTITNNHFTINITKQKHLVMAGDTIRLTSSQQFRVGDTIEVYGTQGLNDGVFDIKAVDSANNTITVRMPSDFDSFIDGTYELATVVLVRYPRDVAYNVLKLMEYEYTTAGKKGLKSETISRLSVTYFDMTANESREGFPASYIEWLDKYTVVKWA